MARDEDLDCHFKLLVSSATISRSARGVLSGGDVLSIPEDAGSGRLLTDRSLRQDLGGPRLIGEYGDGTGQSGAEWKSPERLENIYNHGCE